MGTQRRHRAAPGPPADVEAGDPPLAASPSGAPSHDEAPPPRSGRAPSATPQPFDQAAEPDAPVETVERSEPGDGRGPVAAPMPTTPAPAPPPASSGPAVVPTIAVEGLARVPITGPVPPVRRRTTLAERPGVGRRSAAALGLLAFVLVGGMVLAALVGGAALVLLELLRGTV